MIMIIIIINNDNRKKNHENNETYHTYIDIVSVQTSKQIKLNMIRFYLIFTQSASQNVY